MECQALFLKKVRNIYNFGKFYNLKIYYSCNSSIDGYFAPDAATLDSVYFTIYFSPDMERWAFRTVSDDIYYIGSVDGKYNTQELMEYFHSFIPRNWLGE